MLKASFPFSINKINYYCNWAESLLENSHIDKICSSYDRKYQWSVGKFGQGRSASSLCFMRFHWTSPNPPISRSSTIHHSKMLSSACLFSSYSRVSSKRCMRCSSTNWRVMLIRSFTCDFIARTSSYRMPSTLPLTPLPSIKCVSASYETKTYPLKRTEVLLALVSLGTTAMHASYMVSE